MFSKFIATSLLNASTGNSTEEISCSLLHSTANSSITCAAIKLVEDCHFDDGFVQYIEILYCGFSEQLRPLAFVLMFLWLLFMLIGLATTADVFFGPCLIVMADTLHLSQNVAGVTLLALGNGAPDIFSAVSAATSIKDGDAGLLFGGLLGAGIFVTCITTGGIAIVKPFTAMSRPLLKDIIFYMFAVFWAFIILFKGIITIYESVGFILVYIAYVLITVFSRIIYSKQKGKTNDTEIGEDQGGTNLSQVKITFKSNENNRFATMSNGAGSSAQQQSGTIAQDGYKKQQLQMLEQQQQDEAAGYDTSLDFPGGLRRIEGEPDIEFTAPKSSRFKELDYAERHHQQSSRMKERMSRVSRVKLRSNSSTISPRNSTIESPERKVSTTSFTGLAGKSSYLTRYMLAYGNLENMEHRDSVVSKTSKEGSRKPSTAMESTRKTSSIMKKKTSTSLKPTKKSSTSQQPKRSVSERPARLSTGENQHIHRQGYKLSGGLGIMAANSYFERKKSRQEKVSLSADNDAYEHENEDGRVRKTSYNRKPSDTLDPEVEYELSNRDLYRIESVDEALDDENLERLNRLNQNRMKLDRLKQQEEEEKQKQKVEEHKDEELKDVELNEEEEDEEPGNPCIEFLYSINPIDIEEFRSMSWYNKIYEIIKAPLLFLLLFTTSLTDYDKPLNGWTRILNSWHCAIAPTFILFAFKGYEIALIGGVFPIWAIVFIVGAVIGIVVFLTSSHFKPPVYHPAFAFFGFFTAIIWIYTFANEVVNVLETCGIVFNISTTILGLTVLAWANSIGDVISNTVLARQNFPRIAISACFGGPLFNLLLGVGIPFTIKLLGENTTQIALKLTEVQLILIAFTVIGLVSSMIYLTFANYKVHRPYGIFLIVVYLAFLVLALLAETIGFNIIPK